MLFSRKPATLAKNVQKLEAHSFTSAQALDIYASFPGVAGYEWNSPSNAEKVMYLMLFLQLTTVGIASKAQCLATSLEHKIGPRIEFIYRSQAFSPEMPSGLTWYVTKCSDAVFAARFNVASIS